MYGGQDKRRKVGVEMKHKGKRKRNWLQVSLELIWMMMIVLLCAHRSQGILFRGPQKMTFLVECNLQRFSTLLGRQVRGFLISEETQQLNLNAEIMFPGGGSTLLRTVMGQGNLRPSPLIVGITMLILRHRFPVIVSTIVEDMVTD